MEMEAPEYLDLDEIDFSDDAVYSVSSLKNIPELSRRNDAQTEERPAPPSIGWSRGVSSHGVGGGMKPTGLAEVHSKFRPVKRVSPLKHQPETHESDPDGKVSGQEAGAGEAAKDKPPPTPASSCEGVGGKVKVMEGGTGGAGGAVFGDLEHYDLDMDEILDVPYIKSSQHSSTLPRPPPARSILPGGTLERNHRAKNSSLAHGEPSAASQTPLCLLSPHLRKSKSMDPDVLHRPPGAYQQDALSSSLLSCSSSLSSFSDGDKLLSARGYPEAQNQRAGLEPLGGATLTFPLLGGGSARQEGPKPRPPAPGGVGGGARVFSGVADVDEESKKKQNIINIVREGQISLLPHLAADNLALIRDQDGNNLLHVSASQGHAECLQHLTSLMGEDGLNERNAQQLTPAGLGVKNGHLECVRWMVSETEAIAELSCTREHPSLIHYAARYGQVSHFLSLPVSSPLTTCVRVGEGAAVVAAVHAGAGHLSGRGGPQREHGRARGSTVWSPDMHPGTQVYTVGSPDMSLSPPSLPFSHFFSILSPLCLFSLFLIFLPLFRRLFSYSSSHSLLSFSLSSSMMLPLTFMYDVEVCGVFIGHTCVRACVQTLVEYGSNVTVHNQQGERPSQVAERQGHSTCARYLVVVETCMSLASQVVKLTKQLSEQAAEKVMLQKQLHRLDKSHGAPTSVHQPPGEAWPEMTPTAEGTPADGHWQLCHGGAGPDSAPRQMMGKEAPECSRLLLAGGAGRDGSRRSALAEKRELKLARLKQIMQRSLSESDCDAYPPEEGKKHLAPPTHPPRPDRPSQLPIADEEPASKHLQLMMRKHLPSSADKKSTFSPSPTSSDPEVTDARTPDTPGEADGGPKVATSPKSALKSPSSRRKTSHNLKLRVTFDEHVHQSQEAEPSRGKERSPAGSSESKRPFGTFRSIMESLSGNANHNNSNSPAKRAEPRAGPAGGGAAKAKTRSGNV
ncbi:synphilin-1 isoform X1 [Dunckerocampus dactyliophorus]|uniref:synphilin-1 isoform X1 n=1 Tax=Dunckerocampus dactyliophorus TaxID=161453 RepID=UPI0024071E90|nr:synphilin-1 isoform X1 [Dunckerocampus dactyliophorus]